MSDPEQSYSDQRLIYLNTFILVAKNINGNTPAILPNNKTRENIQNIIFEIERDIKQALNFEKELLIYVMQKPVIKAARLVNLQKDLMRSTNVERTLRWDNDISANPFAIEEKIEGRGEEEGDSKVKSTELLRQFVSMNYDDIKKETPEIDWEQMINTIRERWWMQLHKSGVVKGLNEKYNSLKDLLKNRLSWYTNLYDKTYKKIAEEIESRNDWENVKIDYEIKINELLNTYQSGGKKSKKLPKKEILGKIRCIYKIPGDRKEYLKHKGKLITVKEYKELMKAKPKKKEAKPKKVKKTKSKK